VVATTAPVAMAPPKVVVPAVARVASLN